MVRHHTSLTLNLGTIRVSFADKTKRPNLSVTLTSSCSVAFPGELVPHVNDNGRNAEGDRNAQPCQNPEDLRRACRAGDLWIAKAGSCRVDVETRFNGHVADEEEVGVDGGIVKGLADFVAGLGVWPHTGLELRANHRDGDAHERLATASYFLHHPDLSSEMIAPEGVSRGLFEGLRCEVDYQFGRAKKPTSAKGRGQRKASLGKQAVGEKKTGHSHERRSGNHPSQLRDKPRRSKKAVEAEGLVDNGASGEASTPASQHHTGNDTVKEEDLEVLVMESISDMASLLEFAFRKLVGLKGAATGYRTLKNTVSVSLIELAPAVWNLQYLQTMSIHARAIPSISSGLARLRNAQSSSLRANLVAIRSSHSLGDDSQPKTLQSGIADEIQRRLWRLCQIHIPPDTVKGPLVSSKVRQNTITQSTLSHSVSKHGSRVLFSSKDDICGYHEQSGEDGAFTDDEYEAILQEGISPVIYEHQDHFHEDEDPREWNQSSEGDYFYTDGQGNVYPIDRLEVYENDYFAEWQSTYEDDFNGIDEEYPEEESEEQDDISVNEETYIIYHEVQQHWGPLEMPQEPNHHENVLAHDFPSPSLPYPTDSIPIDWPGD